MRLFRPESSRSRARLLLAGALIAAVAGAGCGGTGESAAVKAGATPDEQAKSSRDYSRALHEQKAKGRPGARH